MKEEKKHLYRIDPLKVKQKLYELYPKGSEAHKMMAREEKIKEYTQLARTLSSMPIEMVKQVAHDNKTVVLKLMIKGLVSGLLGLGFGTLFVFTTTSLEMGLTLGLGIALFTVSMKSFFDAMKIAYSIKNFEDAMKKTNERMEKLKKDIFE